MSTKEKHYAECYSCGAETQVDCDVAADRDRLRDEVDALVDLNSARDITILNLRALLERAGETVLVLKGAARKLETSIQRGEVERRYEFERAVDHLEPARILVVDIRRGLGK